MTRHRKPYPHGVFFSNLLKHATFIKSRTFVLFFLTSGPIIVNSTKISHFMNSPNVQKKYTNNVRQISVRFGKNVRRERW